MTEVCYRATITRQWYAHLPTYMIVASIVSQDDDLPLHGFATGENSIAAAIQRVQQAFSDKCGCPARAITIVYPALEDIR